eukprot:TRINITY_DN690_c0_g1_i1.p1 TRINITY_DN690_c0_g1~~TRINITY_DN690_c0_g1_i1.p1  ORF type:complete len:434 (-),score=104.87 TRINITY_DN690_c0_g1_i1:133-1434(-)
MEQASTTTATTSSTNTTSSASTESNNNNATSTNTCWKCNGALRHENLIGRTCTACYTKGATSSINCHSVTSRQRAELEHKMKVALSVGEECIDESDLRTLLTCGQQNIICYDGFEPSGRMHIAQGLIRAINTNKLTSIGFKFKFWVADWFALMNHKLGGDLEKIKKAGRLMIEVWKASGMKMDNVEFLWTSDEINNNADRYWGLVLDIATRFNLNRIKKCTQIMGREESDELAASQIFYPVMQCADIFFLKADICSLGVDQRKVNMLARDYCDKVDVAAKFGRKTKPIILSHHMILGLDGTKMSKSNPENAIFMDDSPADVKRKVLKAFCEPGNIEKNPPLEYAKHILFEVYTDGVVIERPEKHGGPQVFKTYQDMENAFKDGALHPGDLKGNLVRMLNDLLKPVQQYLETNPEVKKLRDEVASFAITKTIKM